MIDEQHNSGEYTSVLAHMRERVVRAFYDNDNIDWTPGNYRLLCEKFGLPWTEDGDAKWREACAEDERRRG